MRLICWHQQSNQLDFKESSNKQQIRRWQPAESSGKLESRTCVSAVAGWAEPTPCGPASQPLTLLWWPVATCQGEGAIAMVHLWGHCTTRYLQAKLFLLPAKTLTSCQLAIFLSNFCFFEKALKYSYTYKHQNASTWGTAAALGKLCR